ncbi:gamma-glutamyl-gamma-aminobutyrate hydrolase family protein [Nonomuraea sp. NPDC050536]|uniref:gamma-glutamyl-gamma-aminobutyrate hydrolase family protein n=1 Tax=Nonomuraea sp. NPDC050536 TaxID=3364366 RepID=UPI0037CC387E
MTRPVIGISCYVETARFTVWEMTTSLLPHSYVDQVVRAGGQPVVLPPVGEAGSLVDRLDGLILAGGGDMDPARYGQNALDTTGYIRKFRDDAELALMDGALRRGLPFLGICRGMQVLNVALGGTLHQHLPDVVGHGLHSPAPGKYGSLPVRPVPGTRLAELLGEAPVDASHYHHQAIDRLADGLTISAHADDGTIEAVDVDDHPFALAVQWHPEVGTDDRLFKALITAC